MDQDTAYENRAFIPNGDEYPAKWQAAALAWRETEHSVGRARLNLAYGPAERQEFDLFYPAGRPKGLVLFIHGGYWQAFDRKFWSHLAAGATARGWALAMPSYTLAPEVRISQIAREMALALAAAGDQAPGPIVITGHSAGGHLAARLMCPDVVLPDAVAARIARCVPISPLSDLQPLMASKMNAVLQLDRTEAFAESPIHWSRPRRGVVTVWVGAEERPVFLDQARWLVNAWTLAQLRVAPGRHHFDVIDELAEADSPLMAALLDGL